MKAFHLSPDLIRELDRDTKPALLICFSSMEKPTLFSSDVLHVSVLLPSSTHAPEDSENVCVHV